jgi:hypothetical protein
MDAVRIRIGAGASNVELIRPAGVPVRVHIGGGASKLAIDDFSGSGRIDWRSPAYDQFEGRYDIEIGAGARQGHGPNLNPGDCRLRRRDPPRGSRPP